MTMSGQGSRENTAVESDTWIWTSLQWKPYVICLYKGVSRQNQDNVGLDSVKILTGIQIAVGWK